MRRWCRPDSLKGATEKEIDEWRTEYDVISHLKAAGHEVMPLGLSDSLSELRRAITDWKPDIVFNLLEEFDGIVTYDQHVVAFLELMHQPYTGCNPRGMLLSRDKVLVEATAVLSPRAHAAIHGVRARQEAAHSEEAALSRCS